MTYFVAACLFPPILFFLVTAVARLEFPFPWGTLAISLFSIAAATLSARFATPRLRVLDDRTRRLLLACFGLMGVIGYLPLALMASLFWHTQYGTSPHRADDCGPSPVVVSWESCEGKDFSFLQGRNHFYRGRGKPNEEICRRYLATKALKNAGKDVPCDDDEPANFSETDCASAGILAGHRCFTCSRFAETGDTYSRLLAFTEDCSSVTTYASANMPIEEIPKKLEEDR